jgi:hypothetical protein
MPRKPKHRSERRAPEGPPERSAWEELAAKRWGPAIGDSKTGIVIDIDHPARMPTAFIDDFEERAAIFEFEAGIPRAEAEYRAQLFSA